MIYFTTEQLLGIIGQFIFPLARILGLVAIEPILSNKSIPKRVKVGLAGLLAVIIAPLVDVPAEIEPASAYGLLILAQQTMIGLILGFSIRIIFIGFEMAGNIIGYQMGLGFANFFDPQNSAQVPVISQFMGLIILLLFLSVNGHLVMISALVESFKVMPISINSLYAIQFKNLAWFGGEIFKIGVNLSLPIIAVLLVTNVALGVLSRAAPQLNLFSVGFGLTLVLGFLSLYVLFPYMHPLLTRLFEQGLGQGLVFLRNIQ